MFALVLAGAVLPAAAIERSWAGSKPHIITILQDDLGYFDSGIHNEEAVGWTGNITRLAKSGISLTNHYTHWHCSPTRRSFLSGRLPIHHGEQLSGDTTDDIDLRMTWISGKIKKAGYSTHWFGKWHTGFRSWQHLGLNRGFDNTLGSFQTGGPYSGSHHSMRWQNDHPIWRDSEFNDPPPGCDARESTKHARESTKHVHSNASTSTSAVKPSGYSARANPAPPGSCGPSHWRNNTKMQCGTGHHFVASATAGDCCAACQTSAGCTHWVWTGSGPRNCHIKTGSADCGSRQNGSVSGVLGTPAPPGPSPPPPPPPPAGPATCTDEYSTDLWGQGAIQAVTDHDPAKSPIYVHLCFQAVHEPYDAPANNPTANAYTGLLWRADVMIGALVALLQSKGMYDDTIIIYSADNGGVSMGNNYPLRGEKHSNWEGGMRTAAFVSGGFVPAALRGTTNGVNMHIVDWHPTLSYLVGESTTDDPPVPPLPVDPATQFKDIYGNHSFPPLDGVNVWPLLINRTSEPAAAHAFLVLSKEVAIAGRWKLLVSQPNFKTQNGGWKRPDGTWRPPNASETVACQAQDVEPGKSMLPVPGTPGALPCLFDLRADPGEHDDLSSKNPGLVQQLWAQLNLTMLTMRDCNGWSYKGTGRSIPGPTQPDGSTSCSPPELMGTCDPACANAKWAAYGSADGPICGVPGCNGTAARAGMSGT